jgi:hypothetical protein
MSPFKKLTMACIGLFMSVAAYADKTDSTSILFIGNSFTVNNDMPDVVLQLAHQVGLRVRIDSFIALGQSVNYFMNDDTCFQKIKSREWDYVVFQDYQAFFYDSLGTFPPGIFENNLKFQDSIKKWQPCAKIIYEAGWEKKGGIPSRFPGDNTDKLINRILANYAYLNNQPGVHNTLAPVGLAWMHSIHKHPEYELYGTWDFRHPSQMGTFLTGSVMFTTIFKYNPNRHYYVPSYLSEDETKFFTDLAYHAVMDTFDYTNLKSITPELHRDGRKLYTDDEYAKYQWYRNDTLIVGATEMSIEMTKSAVYTLRVINDKGCNYTSFADFMDLSTGIEQQADLDNAIKVYPNPTRGQLYINLKQEAEPQSFVNIYAGDGRLVQTQRLDNQVTASIDLSAVSAGLYIVEVHSGNSITRKKILLENN